MIHTVNIVPEASSDSSLSQHDHNVNSTVHPVIIEDAESAVPEQQQHSSPESPIPFPATTETTTAQLVSPAESVSSSDRENIKSAWATELCRQIVKYELIEHESFLVLEKLCKSLTLEQMSSDLKKATFSLFLPSNNTNILQESSLEDQKIYLHLEAIKGSLFTTLWHMFARCDDEYQLTVDMPISVMSSSMYSSGQCYYFIDYQSTLLWRVNGIDVVNSATHGGEVCWNHLRRLMSLLHIDSIGVLSFTKLLSRLLITLPLFAKTGQYDSPMPLSYMSNFVNVVACSPLELRISPYECDILMNVLHVPRHLLVDGAAIWTKGYYPYWTPTGLKELCSSEKVPKGYFPVGTTDIFEDAAVRIVEICHHPLGQFYNMVIIIEMVHRKKWMQILRLAVLQVDKFFGMVLSNSATSSDHKISQTTRHHINNAESVALYDEMEFYELCNTKLSNNQKMGLYLVDFKNCCTWGATGGSNR